MISFWHNVLGKYVPDQRIMGLDYSKLFLDPESAMSTYYHELMHGVLFHTTEYALATAEIVRAIPGMTGLTGKEKNLVAGLLGSNQFIVQETCASLMEVVQLMNSKNKKSAKEFAESKMHPDYFARYQKVEFVLNLGRKHREAFLNKVPQIALNTDIRKRIGMGELLPNVNELKAYLEDENNNPDSRFSKVIEVLKFKPWLLTRSSAEICQTVGIRENIQVTKAELANYLNSIANLCGRKGLITEKEIRDPYQGEEIVDILNGSIVIGNMNIDFSNNSEHLWNKNDFMHYKDVIEAGFLILYREDVAEHVAVLEKEFGRKFESGIGAFAKNGEKYIYGDTVKEIAKLLNNEFKEITLIVKVSSFIAGMSFPIGFEDSRKPDVVLYNNIEEVEISFSTYFSSDKKAEYVHIRAIEGHMFHTLILIDENKVLHFVNLIGNAKLNDFIIKYKTNLQKRMPADMMSFKKHFNNAFIIWFGMDRRVDWLETIKENRLVLS
jgi:hypothetical protein